MSEDIRKISNRRYRILHTLPDLKIGGGQNVLLQNIIHMDGQRFENHVCYFVPIRDMEPIFTEAGIEPIFLYHRHWWLWPWVLFLLVRYIRRNTIDLVHVQGTPVDSFYGQMAALICGIPVVRTLHGMKFAPKDVSYILRHPRPGFVCRQICEQIRLSVGCLLDAWTIQNVIAASDSVRQSWLPYLLARGIRADHVTVNHNAIPVEVFAKQYSQGELDTFRRSVGVSDADPILINVARLTSGKGQELLIRMMPSVLKKYPNAKLLIVGEGEHRAVLTKNIEDAGLLHHVVLHGRCSDIASLLAISDIFVFSSFFEGFSLTILEAMAAGKPVVAIALPPLRELGVECAGVRLVEQRDSQALAQCVLDILEDRDRMRELGRQAQRHVAEHYNIDAYVKRLESIYESVLIRSFNKCQVAAQAK